jgi:SAM-dependent methyltransferase
MSVPASDFRAEPARAAAPVTASFRLSALKRRKLREITGLLGPTGGLRCLDLGADNGVISALLRRGGGDWVSADLDEEAVASIARLVGGPVYRLDGGRLPFDTDAFDRVVVVDMLEHLHDDREFVAELFRILGPGGELIVNVPHDKPGLLRRLRLALGQTDAAHGHVRPGYTRQTLRACLDGRFDVVAERTYNRACSELLDIATRAVTERLKGAGAGATKGVILVEEDFRRHRVLFAAYAALEPLPRLIASLDALLVGTEGHMLIVKAKSRKPASPGS